MFSKLSLDESSH